MSPPEAVTIHVPAVLRERCRGAAVLRVRAATVRALLGELEERYPELYRCICDGTGAVRRHVNVFVNSSHVRDCGGLDTALARGDVVTVLPAVSGG